VVHSLLRNVLEATRALERVGFLRPDDWPPLATQLLLLDVEHDKVLALACLPPEPSGWATAPIVDDLYTQLGIEEPSANSAVELVARLLASDLRVRSATVSDPMIRMLAKLAPPDYGSKLANECHGYEEYLDCTCVRVDPKFEEDLKALPGISLPDSIIELLARSMRATLPLEQPARSH
jgi:hypothetical protein